MNKKISVVVPCFNEIEIIESSYKKLIDFKKKIINYDIEIIFIDDGSKDSTRELLKDLIKNESGIKIIGFSRNFGHQIAVTAGIENSSGDAIVIIDADLQDPPEVIHKMIEKWESGYDVVYGTRNKRKGETWFKLTTANLFYKILNKLSDVNIPVNTGDFRLIDKKVSEVLKLMTEKDRFLRGMISWVGFKQISIIYDRDERIAGETKYPLKKMIKFAFDGIISFSTRPLQIAIYFGFFTSFFAFLGILYSIYQRFFTNQWIEGWTALFFSILFFGGLQLIFIGILGEYIGRIYIQTKQRPLYIIEEVINN